MAYPGAGEWLADMNYRQHQGMLGLLAGAGPGAASDALAGGMMSRVGAVGRPMISGAMGMLGLDPMSLGLKAGMGAWNAGAGVLGAGMAGAGVMAGVGIAGLGASFVGNQMYSGAQQQLALNQGLRQNYNFINNQGGLGFTSQQGYQIGNTLRGMSHDFGPQGEVATFGELSRLATNMGRMGMASNVRSVQEFKDKFKEMVSTLKQVATDMGTSLEEAQKFVQSMRGSGIFRTADQLRMSHGTRLAAAGGGLAMSEVTGMANIGSQISRSVGGLGRAGAFAGIKTIEQVGLAQRVGALSDEDIYNATGLQGAEGRQAYAASQLQQSARFLSSGRGRRFLASISGKDGQLNEQAAMEYMLGGNVSTGRTMDLAHHNLEGIGRANFIRNEGRLRGAALEKFGGNVQALVYKQWLASRGYDPSNMDDKSMLAFQRFTGLGRDEADAQIKQINAIPDMMREKDFARGELAYSDDLTKYKKSVGIEGLKRKFEQTRERIQGNLQQAGADILQAGSDALGTWFNKTMGIYERQQIEGVNELARMAKMGHTGASSQITQMTHATNALRGIGGLDKMGGLTVNGKGDLVSRSDGSVSGSSLFGASLFGKGSSESEINSIIGRGTIRSGESRHATEGKAMLRSAGEGVLGSLLGPLGALAAGAHQLSELTGGESRDVATGAFVRTREGQQMISGLLEGKGGGFEAAQTRIKELSGKEHLDRTEQAQLDTLRNTQVSRALALKIRETGKSDISQLSESERAGVLAEAKKVFGRDVKWDEVVKGLGSTRDAVTLIEQAGTKQLSDLTQKDIDARREDMVSSGIAEMKDGQLVIKDGATKGMNELAQKAVALSASLANTNFGSTHEERQMALDSIYGNADKGREGDYNRLNKVFNSGSIQDRRAAAKQLGLLSSEGREFAASVAREERLTGTMKKYQTRYDKNGKEIGGRFESAAAELLGVNVNAEMREEFAKGDVSSVAKRIMQEKGVTATGKDAEAYQKQIEEAIRQGRSGNMGLAASALSAVDAGATGEVKKQLEKAKEDKMGPLEKSEVHLKKLAENSDKQLTALNTINESIGKKENPDSGNGSKEPPKPGGG